MTSSVMITDFSELSDGYLMSEYARLCRLAQEASQNAELVVDELYRRYTEEQKTLSEQSS